MVIFFDVIGRGAVSLILKPWFLFFFPYFFFRLTSPDVCLYKPCKNGGTCDSDYINGNYTCDCPDGFYGDTCRLGKWANFFFFFSLVFDMHHNIHRYEVVINVCEWIGWNPIWSEIKHVHFLKRTGRPWSGNPICSSTIRIATKLGDTMSS